MTPDTVWVTEQGRVYHRSLECAWRHHKAATPAHDCPRPTETTVAEAREYPHKRPCKKCAEG